MDKLGEACMSDDAKLEARAEEIFREYDKDSNGTIEPDELLSAMHNAGVKVSNKEVQKMITEADEDGASPASCSSPRPPTVPPTLHAPPTFLAPRRFTRSARAPPSLILGSAPLKSRLQGTAKSISTSSKTS